MRAGLSAGRGGWLNCSASVCRLAQPQPQRTNAAPTTPPSLAEANSIAQEALGNIRTVYAFNGEERMAETYAASLDGPVKVRWHGGCERVATRPACLWRPWQAKAERLLGLVPSIPRGCWASCVTPPLGVQVGIRQGFLGGLVVGITNCAAFSAYALALWYGSTRIVAGDYTGALCVCRAQAVCVRVPACGAAANPCCPLTRPCRRQRGQRSVRRIPRRLCAGSGSAQPAVLHAGTAAKSLAASCASHMLPPALSC